METKIVPEVEEFLKVIKCRVIDLESDLIYERNHHPWRTDFIAEIAERLEENKELLLILNTGKAEIYQ